LDVPFYAKIFGGAGPSPSLRWRRGCVVAAAVVVVAAVVVTIIIVIIFYTPGSIDPPVKNYKLKANITGG